MTLKSVVPVFKKGDRQLLKNHCLTDFLKDRKQRLVLNGQKYSWVNVEAGVPRGSILGPLLFLIHINDLPDNLSTNVCLRHLTIFCSSRYHYFFLRLELRFKQSKKMRLSMENYL